MTNDNHQPSTETPTVSIICHTYNHERFIRQALEGILAQETSFPFEIIVHDDASTDRTQEIIQKISAQNPKANLVLILQKENQRSQGKRAKYITLPISRGKYIAYCEGDDFWHHPRKLQMQVDLMNAHPEMTVCHTDFDRMTRFRLWRNKHRNYPSPWLPKGNAYVSMLHQWTIATCTSMFRREIIEAFQGSKYDNIKWPFGDHPRLLYASLKGTVGYINSSTATYRKVRGSALNRSHEIHLQFQQAAEECNLFFIENNPVPEKTKKNAHKLLKMRIYRAAFYAKRIDIMQDTYEWLNKNGANIPPAIHLLRRIAIHTKLPIFILRTWKSFIDLHISSIQP